MSTRLYLDIDGVINVLDRHCPKPLVPYIFGFGESQVTVHMSVTIVKQFLTQFDEIVWATTWVLYPEELWRMESLLGLPRLETVDLTRDDLRDIHISSSGKHRAVAQHFDAAEPPRHTLWLDDAIGPLDLEVAEARGIHTHAPHAMQGAYPLMEDWLNEGPVWDNTLVH